MYRFPKLPRRHAAMLNCSSQRTNGVFSNIFLTMLSSLWPQQLHIKTAIWDEAEQEVYMNRQGFGALGIKFNLLNKHSTYSMKQSQYILIRKFKTAILTNSNKLFQTHPQCCQKKEKKKHPCVIHDGISLMSRVYHSCQYRHRGTEQPTPKQRIEG